MDKHTRGEWVSERIGSNWLSHIEKGMCFRVRSPEENLANQDICVVYYKPQFEEAKANSKQLASAPELLKALKIIAGIRRDDGAYDKHDMAGAIMIGPTSHRKVDYPPRFLSRVIDVFCYDFSTMIFLLFQDVIEIAENIIFKM